ncbi:MAG: glutathione S-transferase family protein [Thermodesulfovibrionia bacterium]|nr:glutathione S-transferase family protein [Thermodesulfovibrionia bacterium]
MPNITLYHYPNSVCSQKVRLALEEKGIKWENRVVDIGQPMENYEPWYMRLNPKGVVPSLVNGDEVVTDSFRIINYIDQQLEGPALEPDLPEEQSEVKRWLALGDHLPIHALTYGRGGVPGGTQMLEKRLKALDGYKNNNPELTELYEAKIESVKSLKENAENSDNIAEIEGRTEQLMDELESVLSQREYIAGSTYSLADVIWTVLLARLELLGMASLWETSERPALAAYYLRMKNRASFKSANIRTAWEGSLEAIQCRL